MPSASSRHAVAAWDEARRAAGELPSDSLCVCVAVAGRGHLQQRTARAIAGGAAPSGGADGPACHTSVALAAAVACRGLSDILDAGADGDASRAAALASLLVCTDGNGAVAGSSPSIAWPALPLTACAPSPVIVWIAGGATAALPSLRDDLRAALTLRRLIGSIAHACSGDESPMPMIGALVVVVSDDLGYSGSAASIEDAAKVIVAASLKAAGVEATAMRVVVVPVADDTSGSMELAAGIAADAALEACATLAVDHLRHAGGAPETEVAAAESGSEVDVLLDEEEDGASLRAGSTAACHEGTYGPRARVSLCTGRVLKSRILAVPSPDRLPAIPHSGASDVDSHGEGPAWLRLQPPASLQAGFVTQDAVAALRAHLRRQADQRIAYAVGEGRVAELEPSSRTAWIREVEAEAAATGANVHGIFFESSSGHHASAPSTAPSLAAEAQGRYMEQLPGIVVAHCDFIKRAVLEERQAVLASRLQDKAVDAMDALMAVRDVRTSAADGGPAQPHL